MEKPWYSPIIQFGVIRLLTNYFRRWTKRAVSEWKTQLASSPTCLAENGLEIGYVSLTTCNCRCSQPLRQIGEISLMKEMTSVATTMMSEEERSEIDKELNGGSTPLSGGTSTPSVAPPDATTAHPRPTSPLKPASPGFATPVSGTHSHNTEAPTNVTSTSVMVSPGLEGTKEASSSNSKPVPSKDAKDPKRKQKMTPEQRAKLQELDRERRKAMEERIEFLTKKLIEVLRPFVEAKHPGDKDDSETIAFEHRIKREAEDLKLESFGVEVRICIRIPCLCLQR